MTKSLRNDGHFISSSFLWKFSELVLPRGGRLTELASLAGVPVEALSEREWFIPFEKFVRLLEVVESELNYPEIALDMADRQDLSILGPLGSMLCDCNSSEDAIEILLQQLKLVVTGVEIRSIEIDDQTSIEFYCYSPELFIRPQFQNYLLASTARVLKTIIGPEFTLLGCFFCQSKPASDSIHRFLNYFDCPIFFNRGQLRLTLSNELLRKPFDRAKGEMIRKVINIASSNKDIVKKVSQTIVFYLPSGNANLETVARAMGYSKRSLHRELESSATSFRALLESTRLEQANQYLKNSYYNLSDIASLLGYKNLSAFSRSYHRWCGISPSKFREFYLA